MLATRSSREWPYRVTELGASGASFSVTSIYVPHGSVRNAIFVPVFGTTRDLELGAKRGDPLFELVEVLHIEAEMIDGAPLGRRELSHPR